MIVTHFKITQCPEDGGTELAARVEEAGRVGRALLHFPGGIPTGGPGNDCRMIDWLRTLCRRVIVTVRADITTPDPVETLLRAGVSTVVVEEATPPEALSRMPRERTIVAIDPDQYPPDADIDVTTRQLMDRMCTLSPWVSGFMLEPRWTGDQIDLIPMDTVRAIRAAAGNLLWARHPDLTADDAPIFDELGIDAIVDGPDLNLYAESFVRLLKFNRGVIPTVVTDSFGQVLRVAWSSPETVFRTVAGGTTEYCDQAGRPDLRGTGVGRLVRANPDVPRTGLLYVVSPESDGAAAPISDFPIRGSEFGLPRLFEIIRGLKERPRPGSYTSFLFEREDRIPRKLNEEIRELLEADTRDEIAWEAADVLFFLFAYLAGTEVPLDDVVAELLGRKQ